MIVPRSYVCNNRAEDIERRSVTKSFLNFHICRYLIHRHMTRSLNHNLNVFCPSALCKLAESNKLLYLSRVGSVCNTSGTAGVSQTQCYIVLTAYLKYIVKILIKRIFTSVISIHAKMIDPPRDTMFIMRLFRLNFTAVSLLMPQ